MMDAPKSGEHFMHDDTKQRQAEFAAKVEKNYEAFYGESVGRPPEESPAVARYSSVGLRGLVLTCVLFALAAVTMFAVDMVGLETVAAALYWPPATVICAWLLDRKPNP